MKRLVGILGMVLSLWFGLALAQTPAGTSIQNQASATYIDSANQPRSTTSNLVVTVVQQVYSFTITPNSTHSGSPASEANLTSPGQTRTALPGAPAYLAYTITNSGNGTDTINLSVAQGTADNFDLSAPSIVRDANCNGQPDSGEPTVTSITLAQGASACLVLQGTVPASATNGQTANVNLVGTSQGNSSVSDNDNWARVIANTAATLTLTKSASPSSSVTPGQNITYTLTGSNTGGSAAGAVTGVVTLGSTAKNGILITDVIPSGLTYVANSLSGSAGAGTVTLIYSTNGGTSWTSTQPSSGVNAVGMLIEGSGNFFPQGATYTLSFQAQVPSGAASGTSYSNSATLKFDANANGNANDPGETVTSNTTSTTVAAAYNVQVGPYQNPLGSASGTYTAGGYTVTRSGDTQSIASANSGTAVLFRHTLRNTGNTGDSFNLSYTGQPASWSCQLVADDLSTPISGPVGPVAAGADYSFALQCNIPASYTNASATPITVKATSTGDASKSDTTTDTVSQVVSGYGVDAAHNTDGAAGGEPANPANNTRPGYNPAVNPGGSALFPFEVKNTGVNPDTYNLASTLPTGWTVSFYPDANCDGNMDTPQPAPVSSTGLINAGQTKCFIAVVTVPANATPVDVTPGTSDNVQLTVTSTTLGSVSDTLLGAVDVNAVRAFSFTPNRSGTVTSPGTIVYTHTLTNNGNQPATVSIPAYTSAYGWTYQFSTDGGSTWTSSVSGLSLPIGASANLQVRVIVPAGEPVGRSEAANLTATATYASGTATASVTDTTTVVGGDLRLNKSAVSYVGSSSTVRSSSGAQAYPGDQIVYTVVAENIGTANLTKVVVSDPIPAYTTFVSVSATTTISGTVLYSTNGTTWSTTAPSSVPAGGSVYVAVDTNGDNNITAADTMPPAAKITLTLRVQVQ
ncbi:DUF11 domain-containing protein [Meiothermus sp. PNK-Is4]|uniref:beta strand repeat-containing protein n=1 Tax=Meiothermus sp. PNK-Is4 TaxID=2740565 RepID=UPI0010222296|nr:DUF11 domain-containing protein [Meiothermus sp. PNK-Is4]RYM39402.1 DUF11 domain-containing protein [Meiothermus sp. PNK-Is4]